jgi:hypothetical protein
VNRELVRKIANAVLYEGYMLYPYRPSALKNRQRWMFGILYPPTYTEVLSGTERSQMHTECLLETGDRDSVRIELRFLQLVERRLTQVEGEGMNPISSLLVEGNLFESGEEVMERSAEFSITCGTGHENLYFIYCGESSAESLRDSAGCARGVLTRSQHELRGHVFAAVEQIEANLYKLKIDVRNETSFDGHSPRKVALLGSLVSTHLILAAERGRFVSLLDPPESLGEAVRACSNLGNFPVLVGDDGQRDAMLCSPILLYDYPRVATQSAQDFYDATEIEEMLTLRLMTLSDEEKNEMRMADPRMRTLLERTEQSAREQLSRTHGAMHLSHGASDK